MFIEYKGFKISSVIRANGCYIYRNDKLYSIVKSKDEAVKVLKRFEQTAKELEPKSYLFLGYCE